ncbi:MAG TPA: pyridoxal-phosphate dependent enzyme [Polyangiaceae bacterium]|jgi:threonine dehydratase|nr:pyridoxal-phosphate dependent enzyme [Polyangiaceae bacterium]
MRRIEPITIDDVYAARERIASTVARTPLIRLHVDAPAELYLKLESLQAIGSFKLRGATNAIRLLSSTALANAVYTASAGNMAQGVAWGARSLGVACTVVMPDTAPRTKLDAVARLGASIVKLPYDEWWQTLENHGRVGIDGTFIHPVADRGVMAGNGTIGLEIAEDLPDATAVLVPFGGGGLVSGISTAVRRLIPGVQVFGCEVSTSTPLTAALAANEPVTVDRTPSFVDGIGGRGVLPEMWPIVRGLVEGALVAPIDEVAGAVRLLVERARIVAEGAGATAVAAGLALARSRRLAGGKIVCVVSGGNIDSHTLIQLLG